MLWPTLGSAIFIGAIGSNLWRRRGDTKGALPLALVALVLVGWCLAAAAEVAAIDVDEQRLWFVFRDALTLPGVILAFWFALEYAGLERWLTRPVVVVLVGVVIAHVALEFFDGGRMLWSSIVWDREIQGSRAPLGFVFGAIAIGMFVAATAVFLLLFVRSPAHRAPVALILVGQVALRVLYPLGVLNVVYIPNIVSGVVGLDFVTGMYVVALFRFRLLDVVPVARQTIVERMPDALLVLDARDRIADLNSAAARLLDLPRQAMLGRPVVTALAAFPEIAKSIVDPGTPSTDASFATGAGTRTCEVTRTPLADWQGRPIGRLVLLHDTTALRRAEQQLVEQAGDLAAAEERERVARELHDGLAQDLWLAKLKTGRLAALSDLGTEARILAGEVGAAVEAGLAEARHAVVTMRLSSELHGGLRELLARSLDDFEDRFGLSVEFDCDPNLPYLSPRAETEVLRIVHEALTNVHRHADATLVRVRAAVEGDRIVLEVRDNGRGYDPERVGAGSYGLVGMRERAALIGAEIEIETAPRKGTRVRLLMPVTTASVVGAGAS